MKCGYRLEADIQNADAVRLRIRKNISAQGSINY